MQILDNFDPLNKKFNPSDDFNGPVNNRKCTDIFFNILFYIIFIGIFASFVFMIIYQNVEKINYLDFRA